MTEVMSQLGVEAVVVDTCAFGMRVDSGKVQGPAMKSNRILSNLAGVLKRVEKKCPNKGPDETQHHVHVQLEQGRAKLCQIYRREFSRQV